MRQSLAVAILLCAYAESQAATYAVPGGSVPGTIGEGDLLLAGPGSSIAQVSLVDLTPSSASLPVAEFSGGDHGNVWVQGGYARVAGGTFDSMEFEGGNVRPESVSETPYWGALIEGGTIDRLASSATQGLTMIGGSVTTGILDSSRLLIEGGQIDYLNGFGSDVEILGGKVGRVNLSYNGRLSLLGGTLLSLSEIFEGELYIEGGTHGSDFHIDPYFTPVTVVGSAFQLDGSPLEALPGESEIDLESRSGILAAVLADGNTLEWDLATVFGEDIVGAGKPALSPVTLVLIPEPSTASSLLIMALWLMARRCCSRT